MRLQLNGEATTVSGPETVAELLAHLGLEPRKIAVELNLEIVPRSTYEAARIQDGDRIEIVQFVGGG